MIVSLIFFLLHSKQWLISSESFYSILVFPLPENPGAVLPANLPLVLVHSSPRGALEHCLVRTHRTVRMEFKMNKELVATIEKNVKRVA